MKFFISYCQKNGEGLGYAKRAKELCKRKDIEAWVWNEDSSSAELLNEDIAKNVDSCDAMLIIVTTGTKDSEPQKEEWSYASSYSRINCSLRKEGLPIPDVLRSRKSREFNDNNFDEICDEVIKDIVEYMQSDRRVETGEPTTKQSQLHEIAERLAKRQDELSTKTVEEFGKSVWEGYLGSAIVRNIVSLVEASEEDKDNLVSTVIRSNLDLDKFNAEDYWWGPAFKQLGAEIANGEKRFLVKRIQDELEEIKESCNEKDDELSIVVKEIERLNSIGYTPNVILAPPSMLKSFVHFFKDEKGKVDFTREHGNAATLEVEGIKLGIYLLGGGILSENVIMFNRSTMIWKVVPNPDTGYALTTGIGRGLYPDKVGFIIGTTVRCVIAEREGITRIPIER